MPIEISKTAAQAIVYAINYHLEEAGLSETRTARLMAVQLASDIKRVMAEEHERQNSLLYNAPSDDYYERLPWPEFDSSEGV